MKTSEIPSPSVECRSAIRAALDRKTKPLGSLGRLEWLAAEIGAIQHSHSPRAKQKHVIVFAADHGIADEGVSAYPQSVTRQMLLNFVNGGAAINVLARTAGAELTVVDVGVIGDPVEGVRTHKIREGTRNFALEEALTADEVERAIEVGRSVIAETVARGVDIFALGEMGIGNTSSASALLSLLTDECAERTVGHGTGLVAYRVRHKVEVVSRGVALHRNSVRLPLDALRAVGGLEIASLVGAYLGCAEHRRPVLVDGFIATVAALAAVRICPRVRQSMIFAHRSAEPGHELALNALSARPLLDLGMRLGEASGSALAFSLVDTAINILEQMATFADAGVSSAEEQSSHGR